MLSAAGSELTTLVNSDSSLMVLKGNRSSSRRARRTVAKDSEKSSELVCPTSGSSKMPISESEKQQGNVLGCNPSDKLVHLPIKKRRFLLRSPSPPPKIPSPVYEENSSISKSQDDPVQSPVACPVSYKSELGTMSVDKADARGNYPKKVNDKLESDEDFSGISILAAAACSSSLGREFGYAEDCSGVEEPSVLEGPVEVSTNSEAQSLSKGLVKEEFVNTSDISIGGTSSRVTTVLAGEFSIISTADCTSEKLDTLVKSIKDPSHEDGTPTLSSDISSLRDEDVVGSQKLNSRDDRLHWDLNVVMDAWEEPLDDRCVANRSNEDHDLLNEPENSMCDDENKLLQYGPRKLLDQISQGNTRNQVVDDCNHKNQIVRTCDMSVPSEGKNVMSSLGDGDISVKPLLSSYVMKNTTVSAVTVPHTLDVGNESTLKPKMLGKSFDDRRQCLKDDRNCAKMYMVPQVNNDATMEKLQTQNENPQRSCFLQEFTVTSGSKSNSVNFSLIGSEPSEAAVHASISEVKMASAEHLEEKFISDAPADPCSTHETEAAGKLHEDYEDGELREPTGHAWEEYGAVNVKTECIGYVFDNSRYCVTFADHPDSESGQTRRMKHRDVGNVDIISSASGITNELFPEMDRPIVDDIGHGKDDSLLKPVHSGDEKMKGHASSEMLESNKLSPATVSRAGDDCDGKGRIHHLATRSLDSEGTDPRTGSRLYRRGLVSQIEGSVGHDMSFREDQAGNRSKHDGVNARWERASSYIKSSERDGYSMQSQHKAHQVNSWDGSSDVRRVIKCNYSPTYNTQVKPDDGDAAAKEHREGTLNSNTASYLSHPSTNDESIADVDVAGNFQPTNKVHGGLGSDRQMGRGRFLRYGSQMDHGAGRGRYHGPSSNDTFQSSFKYRRPVSQRDRSFSPNERRGYPFAHQAHSRSPSRSRTRSPDTRVSPRGRRSAAGNCGGLYVRHRSRSPNFRSEARMQRMRSPPQHQRFGADRVTGFRPFQRNQGSPPSSRWVNNRKDEPGHFTYKQRPVLDKSPNRIRLRDDRSDLLDSPRNPKPDVYYRQNADRFSEMDETDRPLRLEGNFENRRRQFGPMHTGRRGYEDGIAKRLHQDDDGFVSTNRDATEFHGRGRGTRDIDNRNEDMPKRFRRDGSFMYERDGKFSSNSKQFGFGRMDSSRNFKSGEPYRSMNPGRFNQMDGAGRGQRYVDNHDERRRHYNSAVCLPRRNEIEGIRRRLSHDVDDNLPAPQSSCNDDATDSCGRNARGVDGRMDDQPIRQREEQQLDSSGPEKNLGETSNSTEVEVPAES